MILNLKDDLQMEFLV